MLQLNFSPFPLLITQRLILRQTRPEDVKEMFFLRSDAEVMRYIDRERAKTDADALAHIKLLTDTINENLGVSWAITLKGSDVMIGTIGIWRVQKEDYRGEVGYALHTDYHRQGIMNEALGAVLTYGFTEMELHSLEANINPENLASAKILEKNRFVREAYFRENYYFNGRFLDSAIYSLLASDWLRDA